jgi:NADPH:quinone reductase
LAITRATSRFTRSYRPCSGPTTPLFQADAAAGRLDVKPVRVFRFDEIHEAHRVMEANEARGKMVVVHA